MGSKTKMYLMFKNIFSINKKLLLAWLTIIIISCLCPVNSWAIDETAVDAIEARERAVFNILPETSSDVQISPAAFTVSVLVKQDKNNAGPATLSTIFNRALTTGALRGLTAVGPYLELQDKNHRIMIID
jgi:hypothetical protein